MSVGMSSAVLALLALLMPAVPAGAQPDPLVHPGMEIHQDSVLCTLGYVDPATRTAFTAGHCRASGTVTDKTGTVIGTQGSFRDNTPDGMTVDTEGRLYVTTNLGVQVLDQLGRVHYFLDKPDPAWLSNAVFAGPEKNVLYVTCGGKVFKRKLNATGVIPWQDPVTPPKPRL